MSFQIPKDFDEFSGLGFNELLPFDFNDVDMDRMWTHLLELFVRFGRIAASKADHSAFDSYFSAMVANSAITGLDSDRRREVLDGWLRASLVRMGRKGLNREVVQIDHLRPVTAAVYRSGLPKSRSRHRRADVLIYAMTRAEVDRRGGTGAVERNIRDITISSLGTGIDFGQAAEHVPAYDGLSPIDVNARLALLFMDGIPAPVTIRNRDSYPTVTLPGAMRPIGADVLDCLALYGTALPATELTSHLLSLLSLRLFQLPLRFAISFRELLNSGELSRDCLDPYAANPLEIYCDFTRVRGSDSENLAKACVQRDLEVMRQFFADRLFLRLLYKLDETLPAFTNELKSLHDRPFDRLQFLVQRRSGPEIQQALQMRLSLLEKYLTKAPEFEEGVKLLEALRSAGASTEEQLGQLLVEGLRKRGLENQVKWFWSTGAISKPYGLLRGTLKARRTWRYEPTDPLLLAMLLACFAHESGERTIAQMPVGELLDRLRSRFGILVDRPPAVLDTPRARAAATENRAAFLRQLQLLGCFDGLSDDFSAQIVRRPREASL
jgi:hypothetical protein